MPTHTVLLYEYGRIVSESSELGFYGSGIGALEECLRSCVPERHPKICFYLGRFYSKKSNIFKTYKWYDICSKARVKVSTIFFPPEMLVVIKEFFDENQNFITQMDKV